MENEQGDKTETGITSSTSEGPLSRREAQRNALKEIRQTVDKILADHDVKMTSSLKKTELYKLVEKRDKAIEEAIKRIAAKWKTKSSERNGQR